MGRRTKEDNRKEGWAEEQKKTTEKKYWQKNKRRQQKRIHQNRHYGNCALNPNENSSRVTTDRGVGGGGGGGGGSFLPLVLHRAGKRDGSDRESRNVITRDAGNLGPDICEIRGGL